MLNVGLSCALIFSGLVVSTSAIRIHVRWSLLQEHLARSARFARMISRIHCFTYLGTHLGTYVGTGTLAGTWCRDVPRYMPRYCGTPVGLAEIVIPAARPHLRFPLILLLVHLAPGTPWQGRWHSAAGSPSPGYGHDHDHAAAPFYCGLPLRTLLIMYGDTVVHIYLSFQIPIPILL